MITKVQLYIVFGIVTCVVALLLYFFWYSKSYQLNPVDRALNSAVGFGQTETVRDASTGDFGLDPIWWTMKSLFYGACVGAVAAGIVWFKRRPIVPGGLTADAPPTEAPAPEMPAFAPAPAPEMPAFAPAPAPEMPAQYGEMPAPYVEAPSDLK
jgi:hypothetical protein